jgi:hypothetical protein
MLAKFEFMDAQRSFALYDVVGFATRLEGA